MSSPSSTWFIIHEFLPRDMHKRTRSFCGQRCYFETRWSHGYHVTESRPATVLRTISWHLDPGGAGEYIAQGHSVSRCAHKDPIRGRVIRVPCIEEGGRKESAKKINKWGVMFLHVSWGWNWVGCLSVSKGAGASVYIFGSIGDRWRGLHHGPRNNHI